MTCSWHFHHLSIHVLSHWYQRYRLSSTGGIAAGALRRFFQLRNDFCRQRAAALCQLQVSSSLPEKMVGEFVSLTPHKFTGWCWKVDENDSRYDGIWPFHRMEMDEGLSCSGWWAVPARGRSPSNSYPTKVPRVCRFSTSMSMPLKYPDSSWFHPTFSGFVVGEPLFQSTKETTNIHTNPKFRFSCGRHRFSWSHFSFQSHCSSFFTSSFCFIGKGLEKHLQQLLKWEYEDSKIQTCLVGSFF